MFSGSFQVFSRDILRIIWFGGSCGSSGLDESAWLGGSGWSGVQSLANSRYFLDYSQVADGLNFISNENMDFNDPKDFDDPQALDGPTGISIGSIDFDNPKNYGDTSIFDDLVSI